MRKGTIVILALLLLIAAMAVAILFPDLGLTSQSSSGAAVPLAANEANIRTARMALSWEAVKYGTIYYYYVDGRPEESGTRVSDIVAMPNVSESEAVLTVQESLKRGTYRIIALRMPEGDELTTCPYVVGDTLRDNGFG